MPNQPLPGGREVKPMPMFREPRPVGCSFCGRSADDARGIVAGDGVGICDECVALAHDVLVERGVVTPAARRRDERSARERSTGWLTPPQAVEPDDGVVFVDFAAELDLEVDSGIDPGGSADLRWPPAARPG
jgi:hypothetical protein